MTDNTPFNRITRTYLTGSDQRFRYERLLRSQSGATGSGRTVEIVNDCDGVPGGCLELRIRDHLSRGLAGDPPLWAEAHLTPAEAADIGLALLEAIAHGAGDVWAFSDALGITGAHRLEALEASAYGPPLEAPPDQPRPRWRRWLHR